MRLQRKIANNGETKMKRALAGLAQTAIVCACSFVSVAHATDLSGGWATDASLCDKVFVKKGNTRSFARDSDVYGGGFIMEGRRIRGRFANCNVTKTSEDNGIVHMIAACATDIMLSNVQFSVKVLGDDKITRIFPGIEGMELIYYRCWSR